MRDRGTPFRGIRAIFLAIRNAVPPGLKGDAMRFDTILKQGKLTQTEEAIVSYLVEHPYDAAHMSVRELAAATFVSPSAVIRVCKRLGFKSFGDLKVELARQTEQTSSFERVDADFPSLSADSPDRVAAPISSMEREGIKRTERLLSEVDWSPIIDAMEGAGGITVSAIGYSNLAAQGFIQNVRRLGYRVTECQEVSLGGPWIATCPRDEFHIIVSYSGETNDPVAYAKLLRRRGLKALSVTAEGDNTIKRLTNWNLPLALTERKYVTSRIGFFQSLAETRYALDTLYSVLFARDWEANVRQLSAGLERQGWHLTVTETGEVIRTQEGAGA